MAAKKKKKSNDAEKEAVVKAATEAPPEAAPAKSKDKTKDKAKRKSGIIKAVAEPKEKANRKKAARDTEDDGSEMPTQAAAPITGDELLRAEISDEESEAKTVGSSPVLAAAVVEENGREHTGDETVAVPVGEAIDEAPIPRSAEELARIVEALLFAAEEPIQPREIARAAGSDSATIRKILTTMKESYDKEQRAWDLAEVAGGFRLVTRAEFFPAIQRLKTQTAQRKLTQAALETLALIAYRQPIGRAEIETVRGVGAGPVLRQLLDKKLIKISGRGTGLGQPLLYGTTDYFLEHFGLKSTQELPKPGEFKNT